MKVTSERLENCQVRVIVELDVAEVDEKLRETARTLSREFTVPGYRRGKAPFHAVIRIFGREAVQQQALEDFGNELYEKALEEIEYEPYDTGKLEKVEWDPFRMTIQVPIQPQVDLGDYRSVRVPFEVEEVTDEAVQQHLAGLQQEHAQWVPVERPAEMGDQVVIDVEATAGEETLVDSENLEMLLQESMPERLPGLRDKIVGMAPGEDKTFVLMVPGEGDEEQAEQQEVTVRVQLHTVRWRDLPDLDEELPMLVGDYDSLEALRAAVREQLETEARLRAENDYPNKVLDAMLATAVKVEYPVQALDREADLAINQVEQSLAASGMTMETFLPLIGRTREAYRQDLRPMAEERLRKYLVLNEVARREDLQVEPEAVEAEIEHISRSAGEQAEKMRARLETDEGRESVADDLRIIKARQRVVQIGKGEAPPLEVKDETAETQAEPEAATEAQAEAATQEPEPETAGETQAEAAAQQPEPEAAGEVASENDSGDAQAGAVTKPDRSS